MGGGEWGEKEEERARFLALSSFKGNNLTTRAHLCDFNIQIRGGQGCKMVGTPLSPQKHLK